MFEVDSHPIADAIDSLSQRHIYLYTDDHDSIYDLCWAKNIQKDSLHQFHWSTDQQKLIFSGLTIDSQMIHLDHHQIKLIYHHYIALFHQRR